MSRCLQHWVESQWRRTGPLALLGLPFALLFRQLVALRRAAWHLGLRRSYRAPCPVIVVGNLTVGGSGKTPLVLWLAQWLRGQGWCPGIVSRGYGGRARHWPQQVRPDSDPRVVGDEAVLLARQGDCPVCVGPDRGAAVEALLMHSDCDIVIADDGLQHYALARDIEIVVIDGQGGFGNGLMLPAGPLREPVSRLRSVDLVVCNGECRTDAHRMRMRPTGAVALHDECRVRPLEDWRGERVRAIAGIGRPERFFDMLRRQGLRVEAVAFPDHHDFSAADLAFDDDLPLLMTEKDAVKCRRLIHRDDTWVVRIEAVPEAPFIQRLERLLDERPARAAQAHR